MFIHQKLPLPQKRRFANTDVNAFITALNNLQVSACMKNQQYQFSPYDLLSEINYYKDSEIEVGSENVFFGWHDETQPVIDAWITSGSSVFTNWSGLISYIRIGRGSEAVEVPVIKVVLGGDWEIPICAVIYLGKRHLRFYAPKVGNIFNLLSNTAFGNDERLDDTYCKQLGVSYDDLEDGTVTYDETSMENDISSCFIPF